MNRTGTSRGSSWYGISETSRAPGQPMTAAKRLLSSVMLYACAFSSQPTSPVISPAGHISFRRGRKEPTMVRGSTLCTSSSMTMAGSSTGAKIIWRTVNPACE